MACIGRRQLGPQRTRTMIGSVYRTHDHPDPPHCKEAMVPQSNNTNPTKKVPLLDVSRSNQVLLPEIQKAFDDIMQNGCFVGGKYCQQFEQEMANYCETEFAVGCASGSDALLISLMAIGLKPGDEVILPSFTFFATASAITRLGGILSLLISIQQRSISTLNSFSR